MCPVGVGCRALLAPEALVCFGKLDSQEKDIGQLSESWLGKQRKAVSG